MVLFWSSVTAIGDRSRRLRLSGRGRDHGRSLCARWSPHAGRSATPDVTILKPLHGSEPGLLENLASFCSQDYAGRIQIICGVQDPNDAAVAVVERLRSGEGARDFDLVIEPKVHGLNRKVSNLVNMAPVIRHDVIVIADSDIRVDRNYLSRVIAALQTRQWRRDLPLLRRSRDRRLGTPLRARHQRAFFAERRGRRWRSAARVPASARPLRCGGRR